MNDCGWKVIEGFSSPDDYERFLVWIADQVDAGVLAPISVQESYAGMGFEEKWFRCLVSSGTWRLVSPQAPFYGYWGPV